MWHSFWDRFWVQFRFHFLGSLYFPWNCADPLLGSVLGPENGPLESLMWVSGFWGGSPGQKSLCSLESHQILQGTCAFLTGSSSCERQEKRYWLRFTVITLDGRGHHLLQWYGFAAFIFKCWIGHSKLPPSFLYASCFRSLMVACDIVFGTVFGFNFGSTFWGRFISLEIAQTHFWVQFWDLKMGPWKVWCGCRVWSRHGPGAGSALVALVLWRFWCRSFIRGSACNVLDALERWGQGGGGCRWWRCVIRKCVRSEGKHRENAEKEEVRRGNVGWKCGQSVGKRRESEGFGEQMEVGSVRRVQGMVGGMVGAWSALVPAEIEA